MDIDQRKLVEENVNLVKQVIARSISPNECIAGLGYEDLYQEGCVALCKASGSYSKKEIPFAAYARSVIKNALIDYCRGIENRHAREGPVDLEQIDECLLSDCANISAPEKLDFTLQDAIKLLNDVGTNYTGSMKKGVDALKLRLYGMSGKEIASLYGTRPQLVGAWISKAAKKLRGNSEVLWKLKNQREEHEL